MVVQKFGGTSVADPEAIRRLIEIVRAARTRDARGPAVVVSAMSRVTDGLLGVADSAGASQIAEALSRTQLIRERHLSTARELVSGPTLEPLIEYVQKEELKGLLARRDKIVQMFDDLVKKKGEGAVLYDVHSH